MTVGVTYTFSFWYRQTNSNNFYIGFNNQGGSGDVNGNFQAYSSYGMFPNPTQTWQRCSWTFTNVVDKVYFIIYSSNSVAGSECLMTEFTLTEGSMPGGPGLTTAGNCFNWFASQTDKIITNFNYEGIVTNGLVLNLDAGFLPSFATIPSNANSSTITPWYDLSGNTNNGTLTNGPTFNSANSGSIVWDGVDDYADTGKTATQLGFYDANYTMEAWVYPTSITGDRTMFGTDQPGFRTGLHLIFRGGNIYQGHYASDFNEGTVTTNNWYQIVYTFNASNGACQIFKNSVSQGTGTISSFIGTTNVLIARWGGGTCFQGNGSIYRIYNRVLTQAEVTQNYNAQKGRFGL
jgi:hypothetical protein